jgi:hypothetical protein
VFGVNINEVSSLSDIPNCFVPVVLSNEARVLFEKGVDCVVSINGREGLGRPNLMDDYTLALASTQADGGVEVKMTLVGDGGLVDRINGFHHFVFVVENGNVIIEGFLYLGKEVGMD